MKKAKPDKYDRAVAYLTKHPDQIFEAWCYGEQSPKQHRAHCLFTYATKTGKATFPNCGCLTQIRCHTSFNAETTLLTSLILADDRIPLGGTFLKVEHLPVFAEWQRRIDKELGRK